MAPPVSFSQQRLIRGSALVANYPVLSGIQYNVGDHLLVQSGNVIPVNQYTWNSGPEISNWSGARSQYLGVSLSQWDSSNVRSGNIRAALEGVAQYPLKSASGTTYAPGTPVSFTQDPMTGAVGSGYFNNQVLMQCSGLSTAIGTVVEQVTPSVSGGGIYNIYFQSTKIFGTIQTT